MFIKKKIPVSKTSLPDHNDIYPYLQDIRNEDSTLGKRPLLEHLKFRFQSLFLTEENTVSIMSNAAYALANTLRCLDIPENSYCIMPSWCSPSIPFAATYAGMKPYFIDVDNESWSLDVKATRESLLYIKEKIGAVIVPSSFGEVVDIAKWDEFTEETGVPVVIGASNSFDSIISRSKSIISKTAVVLGFSNQSLLCCGDAGVVVSKDTDLIDRIEKLCTYTLGEDINNIYTGTNGLISEYNAAVCHAALDTWDSVRAKWSHLSSQYIETFIETTLQHRLSFEFIAPTCNIYLLGNNAESTISHLKSKGIESRRWLGMGCHNMNAFNDSPRTSLPVTENLISSVVGLPYYLGMTKKDIEYIVKTLSSNVYGKKTHLRKV